MSESGSGAELEQPRVPDARKDLNVAAAVGREIMSIDQDRAARHLAFSLKPDKIPREFLSAIRDRPTTEVVTAEDVLSAKVASFGISLEAARAIQDGDLNKVDRGVNEDPENLEALIRRMQGGQKLGEELMVTDHERFLSVAKQIIAMHLQVPPEEVKMTPDQMVSWVKDNLTTAIARLVRNLGAVRDYLSV